MLKLALKASRGAVDRTTHLNPTWLVDVSTGSAWRAAGR
jgi:hypothetical protein